MKRDDLTQEQLVELLDYDPLTGVFVWREREGDDLATHAFNANYAGKVAGHKMFKADGGVYCRIGLLRREFMAHRLAYLYMTGKWPEEEIDHKNNDGFDNRWENLRPASRSENACNRGKHRHNKTGFKGVAPLGKRFRAVVQMKGDKRYLGVFDTAAEAAAAYAKAAKELQGEFSRVA